MIENTELMRDIESRYQKASGLQSRDYYSIFYGPLMRSKILMINANPGGSPDNYRVVDVFKGEHEYIEGRSSGPTTRNGAAILLGIVRTDENLRGVQVLNRFFRRSPGRPSKSVENAYMAEAKPFLVELIKFIQPEAIIFGGDGGVRLFADAHGAKLKAGNAIMGPNGVSDAVYYREYGLTLPYFREIPAFGIYHPSKMNRLFGERALPLLQHKLSPFYS